MRRILAFILIATLFVGVAYAADRDELRRTKFEDGADNEVLMQFGNTGTGHMAEWFDGTVDGGTLLMRLYQSGTLATLEAIHAIYLNYTNDGGIGGGLALMAFPEVPTDFPNPPASVGYQYSKDNSGATHPYWEQPDGTVNSMLLGGAGGSGAPIGAKYIVQDPDGDLTNEQALSDLSDGILKHTSGVVAQAASGTDYTDPADYDAKGDIFSATGDNAYARVPIGVEGTALLADPGEASGVRWGGLSTAISDLNINYLVPATAFTNFSALAVYADVDSMAATSNFHAVEVTSVGSTSGHSYAFSSRGTAMGLITQHIGTFNTPDQTTPDAYAGEIPSGGSWSDGIDGNTLFEDDNDEVYIGAVGKFSEIEVILGTAASQDVWLVFEYQHTDTSWDEFSPVDGTLGMRFNSIISWDSDDLTNWKSDSDPGGGDSAAGYWIRMRRERNTVATDPIATTFKIREPAEYGWDAVGDITAKSITLDTAILHSVLNNDETSGNPHSVTKAELGLTNVLDIKHKIDATQAPTVNNDVDEGYTAGSNWTDVTNDKAYTCLDNTDGAAVWTETTGAGGGGSGGNEYLSFEVRFGVPKLNLDIVDLRQGMDTTNWHPYAKRTALSGADTQSNLWAAVQLPSDFDSFYSGTNIWIQVYSNDRANNTITLSVYDDTGDVDDGVNAADIEPGSDATWAEASDQITETDANYAAGDWIFLEVIVVLDANDYYYIGEGHIRYTKS